MFETQGGLWNQTQDLPKKGSALITSSEHWTEHLFASLYVQDALALPEVPLRPRLVSRCVFCRTSACSCLGHMSGAR